MKHSLAIAYGIKRQNKARGGMIKPAEALEQAKMYELDKEENVDSNTLSMGGDPEYSMPVDNSTASSQKVNKPHLSEGGVVEDAPEALQEASEYELMKERTARAVRMSRGGMCYAKGGMAETAIPDELSKWTPGMMHDNPEAEIEGDSENHKRMLSRILANIALQHKNAG